MRPFTATVINAVTNTGSGTIVSSPFDGQFLAYLSAQGTFTDGSAAGTLKLQGSNNPLNPPPTTSFNDIPNATVTVASGAMSVTAIPAAPLSYRWIRVAFASSGGSGTFTVNAHGWGY